MIHTIGPWPLKLSSKYGQIGGTWIYPMKDEKTGDDLVSIGFVIDLEYADATTSAHDLLQLFKTHPLVRRILEGGERVAWGAKALPGGGYWSMPKLHDARRAARRRHRRHGRHGGAQGRPPLRSSSGMLAAEAIYAALKRGSTDLSAYEQAVEDSSIGKELYEVRNTRQPFQKGFVKGGPMVNLIDRDEGQASPAAARAGTATTRARCSSATRKDSYPKPDGKYTFDKLSSVFITGNATRDDAPNHIRVQKNVPREVAETWRWMCPAGVYEIPDDAPEHGNVDVDRQLHQLRAVRGDHGQGRAPDDARGRRRAALPDHLATRGRRPAGGGGHARRGGRARVDAGDGRGSARPSSSSRSSAQRASKWMPQPSRSSASAVVAPERRAVGSVGGHRVPGVGHRDDTRLERDLLAGQAARVAGAVDALVDVAHPGDERLEALDARRTSSGARARRGCGRPRAPRR